MGVTGQVIKYQECPRRKQVKPNQTTTPAASRTDIVLQGATNKRADMEQLEDNAMQDSSSDGRKGDSHLSALGEGNSKALEISVTLETQITNC